jgi:hypothetical protein
MDCFDISGLVREPMKTIQSNRTAISKSLLFQLIAVHVFGTIFAYTFYIKIASLGDGYLPEDFGGFDSEFSSTIFVHGIYAFIGALLPGFLSPMALGIVVALVIWDSFREVYSQANRNLFWLCNLLPHFLIWSGSSSKEQIVIICGVIIVGCSVKNFFSIPVSHLRMILSIVSLAIILLIRPNYFIIYITVFLNSLFISTSSKSFLNKLSFGLLSTLFVALFLMMSVLVIYNWEYVSINLLVFMKAVEISFSSYQGNTTRLNIQWVDSIDFFSNSVWGVPQGFIGPTLREAMLSPIQIPVFLEGILYICIIIFLFFRLLIISKFYNKLRFQLMIFFLSSFIVIYISYPYLIFNIGSSLRYKQSLHPILIFFPLLVILYVKSGKISKRHSKSCSTGCDLQNLLREIPK